MASGGRSSADDSVHLLRQLSHQSSCESGVGEELELLSNVYFDDLQISSKDKLHSLSLHVTPSTADDKGKQYVYLDLSITLSPQYPHQVPDICVRQSRGLSDAHLRGISEGLALKSAELVGAPMIYELVEYARECLTDNNLPCSRCAVCQMHFQDGDDFTKTECYHYLHVVCLARYVEFFERERREAEREEAMVDTMLRKKPKQLECPVCREVIPATSPCLDVVRQVQLDAVQSDDIIHFTVSSELKVWQEKMASLLWRQKQKGGVIDPNSEDDVIDESWVSQASRRVSSEHVKVDGLSKEHCTETANEVMKLVGNVATKEKCDDDKIVDCGDQRRRKERGQISDRAGNQRDNGRSPGGRTSQRYDHDRDREVRGQRHHGYRGSGRGRYGERGQRRDRKDEEGWTRSYPQQDTPRKGMGQRSRGRAKPSRGRGGRKADSASDKVTANSREMMKGETKDSPAPIERSSTHRECRTET